MQLRTARLLLSFAILVGAVIAPEAPDAAPGAKPLKVLVVGGGDAHNFAKWWGDVDLVLLNAMPGVRILA
jgi:hypothetical protein